MWVERCEGKVQREEVWEGRCGKREGVGRGKVWKEGRCEREGVGRGKV